MRSPNCACATCGKPIYRRPWELAEFEHVYCSRQCYGAAIRLQARKCPMCGSEFSPGKSAAKYCSRTCSNMARKGGTYAEDAKVNHSRKRLSILKRVFDFRHCMVEGCNYNETYEIHRFVPGKLGGAYEIGNMFAICPNHHAEASRGLIKLEKVSDSQLRIIEERRILEQG